MRRFQPTLLAALFVLVACGGGGEVEPPAAPSRAALGRAEPGPVRAEPAPPTPSEQSDDVGSRVLFLGTSLTAGLGLSEPEAYPARVAELLAARGRPIEAINAGVSGDTSAGGLERLDWLLRIPPDVVLIELGANDGLRGLPVEMTEKNLLEAVALCRAAGARVVIAGMLMPPNYGKDYTRRFAAVFPRVADETGSLLVPFLLDGVAADPELNLPDGIHPSSAGHEVIAQTVLPYLLEALEAELAPGAAAS